MAIFAKIDPNPPSPHHYDEPGPTVLGSLAINRTKSCGRATLAIPAQPRGSEATGCTH